MAGERNFLLFRNPLFLDYPSDEDIGRYFVGGDCLGWIYARLLPRPDLKDVSCPLMEDWGWYAAIETRDTKVRVELVLYSPATSLWLLGINVKQKLFWQQPLAVRQEAHHRVADAIDAILRADDNFQSFGWHATDQLDYSSFMGDATYQNRIAQANQRWRDVTSRKCTKCEALCPEYRRRCLSCGYELGRSQ